MDRADFIEKAPAYYALAICSVLISSGDSTTRLAIEQHFTRDDDQEPDGVRSLLGRHEIFERAIKWLSKREMITVLEDPFGPSIFSRAEAFIEKWHQLKNEPPFLNYHMSGSGAAWLIAALYSLDNHYTNLGIKAADFENPDAEWDPIQIDPMEPLVTEAIEKLATAIEEIRSDNGYNSTLPQERDYVLEGLNSALDKLKSDSISPGYIRVALERLRMAARRFAGTVKEKSIDGAKQSLMEFAKRHMSDALNYLWNLLF